MRAIRHQPLAELVAILTHRLATDSATFVGDKTQDRKGVSALRLNQFSRRYIFHLLARVTSFTEAHSGQPDRFAQYVNRTLKNPYDIEHVWPDNYAAYHNQFGSEQEFQDARNHVAALLLLPADVNRSLQAMPYSTKVAHYAGQNLYAASLAPAVYAHQPQFEALRSHYDLAFHPYATFGPTELGERQSLLQRLVDLVWASDRLSEFMDDAPGGGR
ncbi:MAG: GmrSD restriction endonuclease domain-containing protein [Clostridia bacterium]